MTSSQHHYYYDDDDDDSSSSSSFYYSLKGCYTLRTKQGAFGNNMILRSSDLLSRYERSLDLSGQDRVMLLCPNHSLYFFNFVCKT